LETKAHSRLDSISPRNIAGKTVEDNQCEETVVNSIVSSIEQASEQNKYTKSKYINVVNAKGKLYINFIATINKKKEEVKLLMVSSIDKVSNDKLCFI